MGSAKLIRMVPEMNPDAALYRLSDLLAYPDDAERDIAPTYYVLVSAVVAPFTGPETYIFPADREGHILCWGEMPGSFRGGLSHKQALENAGYTLEE